MRSFRKEQAATRVASHCPTKLLFSKQPHRIDAHRAAGRLPRRGQRHHEQHDRNAGDGERIGRLDFIEQRSHHAHERHREQDTDRQPDRRQREAVHQDRAANAVRPGAERQPNADLSSSLPHRR